MIETFRNDNTEVFFLRVIFALLPFLLGVIRGKEFPLILRKTLFLSQLYFVFIFSVFVFAFSGGYRGISFPYSRGYKGEPPYCQ